MSATQRFRRLTDLFVTGKAVRMPDKSHLWVQVINSFERDECVNDAQVARSRIVLALKNKGDERTKVEARLAEHGKDFMAADLARAKAQAKTADYVDEMRVDPEWKERMDMIIRTDFSQAAKPPTDEETALIDATNAEVMAEMKSRENDEAAFLERSYARMSDEEFMDVWMEEWLDRRGGEQATAEYRLTELWYAARYCEAVEIDGELDHGRCEGHRQLVFDSKNDARSAPTELNQLLRAALDELNLQGRDPKGSANTASSSDSSPAPSEEEGSEPSTSEPVPATVPGT